MYIFFILLLLTSPVIAKPKTILIKRGKPKRQALLDYKFVFMEEQSAFEPTNSQEPSSRRSNPVRAQLTSLSQPLAMKQKVITKAPTVAPTGSSGLLRSTRTLSSRSATETDDRSSPDIYNESDWDDYAVESEENLGVRAWITGGGI